MTPKEIKESMHLYFLCFDRESVGLIVNGQGRPILIGVREEDLIDFTLAFNDANAKIEPIDVEDAIRMAVEERSS